jgi:GH24 family phage-related lysozyme (muramidase)
MIPNRGEMSGLVSYKTKTNTPSLLATLQEKQAEYDKTVKLPYGQRYGAATYKKYITLEMKDSDVNKLRDKHIASFYKELINIYTKANGYPDELDNFHKNVQLALFDMIFNLGATKIVNVFTKFDKAIKAGDWKKTASESNRTDVNAARNQYVKQLLQSVPTKSGATVP